MNENNTVPTLSSLSSPTDVPESLTVTPEGYSYVFVPPLDPKYECPICLMVLREPRQTECGHRFCRDCIARWMNGSSNLCPVDKKPLMPCEIYPDNGTKREILSYDIQCPNHIHGCQQLTTILQKQNHLDKCLYSLTPCPLSCSHLILGLHIEDHVKSRCGNRQVMCQNCQAYMTASQLDKHKPACPKEAVTCSHCKTTVLRQEYEHHLQAVCRNIAVPCPFQALGCPQIIQREMEGLHLSSDIPSHLKMLATSFNHLIDNLNTLAASFHHRTQNGSSRQYAWQTSLEESAPQEGQVRRGSDPDNLYRRQNQNFGRNQEQIYFPSNEPGCQRSVPNTGGAQVSNELNESSYGASFQNSPLHHSLPPSVMEDNSTNTTAASSITSGNPGLPLTSSQSVPALYHSKKVKRSSNPELVSPRDKGDNYAASSISDFTNSLQELCLFQQRMLESQQSIVNKLCSKLAATESRVHALETEGSPQHCCGDFYWTISEFNMCREKALTEETTILHSPPFYSSPWGYKLCLRVNINGTVNSQGEHFVSLFIHFMQGRNDHLLNWPFTGQIVLTIVDQNPSCKDRLHVSETLKARPDIAAFQKPTSVRNHKGFGYTDFISLNALFIGRYIQDDCLIVRAQVFPSP